jgi:Patatin-like phospholipase
VVKDAGMGITHWLSSIIGRVLSALGFLSQHAALFFHHCYLTRVSSLGLLVLFLLPLLAMGPLRIVVLGAFDVSTWKEAALIGFTLMVTGGSLIHQRKLVEMHAADRFGAQFASLIPGVNRFWNWILAVAVFLSSLTVLRASERDLFATLLGGLALGVAVGMVVRKGLSFAERKLGTVRHSVGIRQLVRLGLPESPGLIVPENKKLRFSAQNASLADGHLSAAVYGLCLVSVFVLVDEAWIHPLASVLLLIAVLTLLLSFFAFLLDRYRVPVLLGVVLYFGFMTLWRESDHYYPLKPKPAFAVLPTPTEIVGKVGLQDQPLVVVTAAGGGIQSAAWTTRVLQQIDEQMAEAGHPGFHQSVRLISGVSGGSVGALHYVEAFGHEQAERFDHAASAAAASSLSSALLGMIQKDLQRAAFPILVTLKKSLFEDRGQMLEQAWARNGKALMNDSQLAEATLFGWAEDARQLKRPAVIFNSSLVETGERVAISTVPRRTKPYPLRRAGNFEFAERYLADLPMVTAARLSATFPLVSPAARPALVGESGRGEIMPELQARQVFPFGGSLHHMVDGGYFENSGMVGALEWLGEAFEDLTELRDTHPAVRMPKKVLIIELSAFPKEAWSSKPLDAKTTSQGALFDMISPAITIINVRNSGQASFANQLRLQFQQRWRLEKDLEIQYLTIYPESVKAKDAAELTFMEKVKKGFFIAADLDHAPLSWHLRKSEIAQINEAAGAAVKKILDSPQENVFRVVSIEKQAEYDAESLRPKKAEPKSGPTNLDLLKRFIQPQTGGKL